MVANNVRTVWHELGALGLLRQLWSEGVPASAMATRIAAATGFKVTSNAVIGKVHRLGLHKEFPRGNCGGAEAQRVTGAIKSRAKQMKAGRKLPPSAPIVADVSNARPWLERERGQCAFPLGGRGAVMSCCFPTEETYCPAHRQAMGGYRKPWTGKDHAHPQGCPPFSNKVVAIDAPSNSEAA